MGPGYPNTWKTDSNIGGRKVALLRNMDGHLYTAPVGRMVGQWTEDTDKAERAFMPQTEGQTMALMLFTRNGGSL